MGKVTWGKGTDGRWYVRRGDAFLADFGTADAKRTAQNLAASIAGGAHRTLETVYTIPSDEPHPKAYEVQPPVTENDEAWLAEQVAESINQALTLSIPKLEAELAAGKHDAYLDRLEAAEAVGKNRTGALEAIEDRQDELA